MTIAEDVTALLDHPGNAYPGTSSVAAAVAQITVMVRAYTRGRGFDEDEPNDELAAVITTAAARLAVNGSGVGFRTKVNDVEEEWRTGFTGWTLAELAVLNRYRVTAM